MINVEEAVSHLLQENTDLDTIATVATALRENPESVALRPLSAARSRMFGIPRSPERERAWNAVSTAINETLTSAERAGDLEALGDAVRAGDPWLAERASVALGRMGDPRALDALMEGLARLSGATNPPSSATKAGRKAMAREAMARNAGGTPTLEAHKECSTLAWAIGNLGDRRGADPLLKLMQFKRAGPSDAPLRIAAAAALNALGVDVVEKLDLGIDRADADSVLASALERIYEFGPTRAEYDDGDLLSKYFKERKAPRGVSGFSDQDVALVLDAAESLSLMGDRRAAEPLIDALERGFTPGARPTSGTQFEGIALWIRAMGCLDDPRPVQPVETVTKELSQRRDLDVLPQYGRILGEAKHALDLLRVP
jgi:HEAT repeat protein